MTNLKKLQNLNKLPKQKIALVLGNSGCYFLSLIKIAEKITNSNIDIIQAFSDCVQKGWITSECYVNNPDLIITFFTGLKSKILKKSNVNYIAKENDYVIGCFKWQQFSHFVLLDKNNKVAYDPLDKSNVCKYGELDSLRVIEIVN